MSKTQTERGKIRTEHTDSWIAVEPGDTIMGKIVDVTDAWSDQRRDPKTGRQGSPYPLLTVETAEATGYTFSNGPIELKVHCFGAVLFNEIMRKQPPVGARIRITYKGPGEAKPGQNPPELYAVRVEGDGDAASRAYANIGGSPRPGNGPVQPELAADQAADDIPF